MLDKTLYYIVLVGLFSLVAMPYLVSYIRTKDVLLAFVVAIIFDLAALVAVFATYKLFKEKK